MCFAWIGYKLFRRLNICLESHFRTVFFLTTKLQLSDFRHHKWVIFFTTTKYIFTHTNELDFLFDIYSKVWYVKIGQNQWEARRGIWNELDRIIYLRMIWKVLTSRWGALRDNWWINYVPFYTYQGFFTDWRCVMLETFVTVILLTVFWTTVLWTFISLMVGLLKGSDD